MLPSVRTPRLQPTYGNERGISVTGKGTPKRVLIVDDHPIVRDGLTLMISGQDDLVVCGEAGSLSDALTAVQRHKPDLVLVDVFLEGSNGIELTKQLHMRDPDLPVLVLSMHDETVYAERALRAGAVGYVMKQQASRAILDAIRTVLRGETYLSDRIRTLLADAARNLREQRRELPLTRLSDRELDIFERIGHGRSRQKIADSLGISVKTFEAHRSHIREKLNLGSSAELLRRACLWVEQRED